MPTFSSAAPRNMLPPPTTTAICTSVTAQICSAMEATTFGSMPSGSLPANASPEIFSRTRDQRGDVVSPGSVTAPPRSLLLGLGLPDLEAYEPLHADARVVQHLLDRLLAVLHGG